MRIYIPDSFDRKVNRALKELELFKQAVLHNEKRSVKDLEKVINLLQKESRFKKCVNLLNEAHHVLDVETDLLVVERLKEAMRVLNNLR